MTTPLQAPGPADARYRTSLPQLAGGLFVTDGGLETDLIFHHGIELPLFAAFPLVEDEAGVAALRRYYDGYASIARDREAGLVLESPTWRANPDWAAQLGCDRDALERANRRAIALMEEIRAVHEREVSPIVVSGCVGPQGDGYSPASTMSAAEAERYHGEQIGTFADTSADLVTAMTMTYAEEAIGVTRAARAAGIPVAVSFTVETDGRLPSGQSLADAIAQVDEETGGGPDYYMINCAHPTHFDAVLTPGAPWLERIRGLRANSSRMSHAELDEAPELDEGDPVELGRQYRALREQLPALTVLGGCCGTDHRHVAEIAAAWKA